MEHLFVLCAATRMVEKKVQQLCLCERVDRPSDEEISWTGEHWYADMFEIRLNRLGVAPPIYQIWRRRHEILHQGGKWNQESFMAKMIKDERFAVTSREKTERIWKLALEWGIGQSIFL